MWKTINVLILLEEKGEKYKNLPDYINVTYKEVLTEVPKTYYDIVILNKCPDKSEMALLQRVTAAYRLFMSDRVVVSEELEYFFKCHMGRIIAAEKIEAFLIRDGKNYFDISYGEKYIHTNIGIAQGFEGEILWNGNYSVTLFGEYGDDFKQVAFWRGYIPIEDGQALDFWLEYKKTEDVEIRLKVTSILSGSTDVIKDTWYFSEEDMERAVTVENEKSRAYLSVSVEAKGKGKLDIVALHDRYSRRGHGVFLPGGKRVVTKDREEIFYYFDPGDMKPPLNVFFAGFRTAEGFEGYYMMKKMGAPFLLIAESRLTGGSFYIGSEEYEKNLLYIIKKYMKKLGFKNREVVMSGISMGSTAAIYYGCDIRSKYIIMGKPIINLGDVAKHERINRPGVFPTSLDMINFLAGNDNEYSTEALNAKMWKKIQSTEWSDTRLIMSYMIEDDYDDKAYDMLISKINEKGAWIYGKGIHGRHNDESVEIVKWFKSQYEEVLKEYGRE